MVIVGGDEVHGLHASPPQLLLSLVHQPGADPPARLQRLHGDDLRPVAVHGPSNKPDFVAIAGAPGYALHIRRHVLPRGGNDGQAPLFMPKPGDELRGRRLNIAFH